VRTAEINARIAAIASRRHGLIQTDLAAAAGISRQLLHLRAKAGVLEVVDDGVFRVAGAPRSWKQRALAACWGQGPEALLSHRAAAMLWELDGIRQAPLEVLVPRWGRRRRRSGTMVHETRDLVDPDRAQRDHIPCTSIVRTLLDLPAVLDARRADQLWEDALRRRLTSVDLISDRFLQVARPGRPGTRVARSLLEKRLDAYVPTMSEFERKTCDLLDAAGIEPPVRQHPVRLPGGRVVFLDLAWPDRLLALECDGLFDHATNLRLPWDDDRQNELQLLGWLVLRATWQTVHESPEVVVSQVRQGLDRPLSANLRT
jgi:hypothetical protein